MCNPKIPEEHQLSLLSLMGLEIESHMGQLLVEQFVKTCTAAQAISLWKKVIVL